MPKPRAVVRRALRTAVHNNASAYGYSIMITSSFGVLQVTVGPPSLPRIFLLLLGAVLAFATVDLAASNLFRERVREERPEVVVLGGALGIASVTVSVAIAAGVGTLSDSWLAWLLAPFAATTAYVLVAGIELSLAEYVQERSANQD